MRLVPLRNGAEGAVGDLRRGFYCAGDCRASWAVLGELIGWRNVFNAAADGRCVFSGLSNHCLHCQANPRIRKQNTFRLLQRPGVMAGMIAIFMSSPGSLVSSHIRPVYMNLAGFSVDGLTLVLLSFALPALSVRRFRHSFLNVR